MRWTSSLARRLRRKPPADDEDRPPDVGFYLRALFVRRALDQGREPADVAAAFAWAYDEVQGRLPNASAEVVQEQVDEWVDDNLEFAVRLSLDGLDVQRPGVLEHDAAIGSSIRGMVAEGFGSPLDELRVLRAVAEESCVLFHRSTEEHDLRHQALARLTGRGLLIADEICCLLAAGYPGGALARWRSLHEVSVVARIIAGNDEATAERYLRHEVVGRAKAARAYRDHATELFDHPLDDATIDEILAARQAAIDEYGKDFRDAYGWAAHLCRGADFRRLEQLAERDWLRPYYDMANHPIHAGAANLLTEIGIDDDNAILTGPSPTGLTDPLQLTAKSLVFLVEQMLDDESREDWLHWSLRMRALDELDKRVVEALDPAAVENDPAAAPRRQDAEPDDPPHALPSMLSWPDVSWEEITKDLPVRLPD